MIYATKAVKSFIISFALALGLSAGAFADPAASRATVGGAPWSAGGGPITDYFFTIVPLDEAHKYWGVPGEEALNPYSIKALVWNIKKSQEPGWEEEFKRYAHGSDLLLIQEAYINPLFTRVAQELGPYRWDMGISFLYRRRNNIPTGTMIAAKTQPSQVIVKHSEDEEPIVGTPKSLTFAKYPIRSTDKELLAVSVHGINLTSHSTFVRHMAQAAKVIKNHVGPVLFAGDFNTRTKRRTRHLMELVKKLKLKEVKFKHAEYRMVWKFTRNYLDHGFVRGLSVLGAEVLKDSRGSDHKPMVLDLALED